MLDFFEDLGAQYELKSGVDDGVDIVGVFLFAAVVEEDIDDFEAEELEVEEVGVASGGRLPFLPAHDPVDEGNEVIQAVGQNQIIPVDSE